MNDKLQACIDLTRANKPIGTYLLLWPTLWALWFSAEGVPPLGLMIIFALGVFLTRSAGCVINDFADRKVDGHVKRTANRPLPTGRISAKEAILLFVGLMVLAFLLVLLTNKETILMSFGGLALAFCYPFMKRYTHLPQVVLGAAFGWGIPMAFTAIGGTVPLVGWVLFFAKLLWTVAYDTMYAMCDRDDDLKVGIKSTAILFGDNDKLIIGLLQIATLLLMVWAGTLADMGVIYYLSLVGAAGFFIYQQWKIRKRLRMPCFEAFLNNHWAELVVLVGVIIDFALR